MPSSFYIDQYNIMQAAILHTVCIMQTMAAFSRIHRGRIQLSAEKVARFQRFFPNPGWLMSGRTSGHQNFVSIFPGIDNCLEA